MIALHPTLLKTAFVYFAKYPLKEGVIKSMFRIGSASLDGYNELRQEINALNPNSLLPEIVNFLFSANEDKLKTEIEDTDGIFMLLDYGQISSSTDNLNRHNDSMELGIIIAQKLIPDNYDMAQMLILQDKLLNLIRSIRETMIEDSKCSPFVKQLTLPHQINPWYARELSNATGFSMTFNKSGYDLI